MNSYTENSSQIAVTASQFPASPTAIEWAAILGLRAAGVWVDPGDWLVRYADGSFVGVRAAAFATNYTAVP